MLKPAVVFAALLALTTALRCPDGNTCEDGDTCCQSPSGEYACCPLPHAVCCEDHLHCCYEGTLCDLQRNKCLNKTDVLPLVRRVSAKPPRLPKSSPVVSSFSEDVHYNSTCPDNTSCPSEYNCLKSPIGYSCCPFLQGVLCSDGTKCCPQGYKCGEDGKSCIKPKVSVGVVICPNEEFECPGSATCCQLPEGSWGCCPMLKAVCCEDKLHCCPEGSTCDLQNSQCHSPIYGSAPIWDHFPARKRAHWEDRKGVGRNESAVIVTAKKKPTVICPDGHAKCPDNSTCCQLKNASYGCCSFHNAVCCLDGVHCCPGGTTCDLEHNTCLPTRPKDHVTAKAPTAPCDAATNVPCNGSVACVDGSTCCKSQSGGWECCPLPEGVCCEDHIHCCPQGTTCDLAKGSCDDSTGSTPWLEKVPALTKNCEKAGNVTCDSSHSCPDGTTCCKKETGEWACCPLPQAVCCEDHIHCCPQGTTCDLAKGSCDDSTGSTPWLEKVPALTKNCEKAGNVTCDSSHSCPDGTTCCKKETGEWACCPLPQAVCCEDHIHCCPQGTTCDLAKGSCDDSTGSTPWLEKVPALTKNCEKAGNVTCDSSHSCPDGTTCCKKETGEWACCPLPQAVCCEDHIHCCPQGTTCDLAKGSCDDSTGSTPWLEKVPALTKNCEKAGNVTCDSSHSCPDGTTCCKKETGEWACCPLPQAVCCEDHIHCCPQGTTCDLAKGSCDDSTGSTPWLEKVPALTKNCEKAGNVTCDSSHYCPDGTTCCKKETGEWACCELPQAVCCEDHEHCCPQGYQCDVSQQTCYKTGTQSRPWVKNQPALKTGLKGADTNLDRIHCGSNVSCPSDNTCCFMQKSKQWGCCPLPNAVCCEDGEHCCPKNYKCDAQQTSCIRGHQTIPWYNKLESHGHPVTPANMKCDEWTSCASGATCCQFPSGRWGCCPVVKPPERPKGIQCSKAFTCSSRETCCRTSATTWSCCPSQKAVCCKDLKHCCPKGYRCDPVLGSCTKSGELRWDSWDIFFARRRLLVPL